MGEKAFRSEDRIGLAVAVVLHLLLVAVIALQVLVAPSSPPVPERVTVSLATEVGLEATAPELVPESRAAIAPTLADEPVERVEPERREPVAQPRPEPRPEPRTERRETPPPDTRERRRPEPTRAETSGGGRIGDNFLEGQGGSTITDETRIPASQIGRSARASLQQAINRQLKPHWSAPIGVDAELLVSVVSWRLNEDGSLAGSPQCRTERSSVTDSNRPQAPLHCERAIRAVRQAAPFDLPDEYYEAWKNITAWRFDRRL
ncbi:energy transducer TonB [Qipengyuania nanhaisediminis]|uniref:energy transducer TonB n=1 Tax=Qipengyuania nanhaisediminis TaxID=604088 RepID=UPI0038B29EF0